MEIKLNNGSVEDKMIKEMSSQGCMDNSKRKVAFTLAEVFSVHLKDGRKHAFTLAEVLITLGIIGVVAAMTLPVLIQKYQKKAWVTALKKDYTMLNDGFRQMMAAEGVDRFDHTSLFIEMPPNNSNQRLEAAIARKYIEKYFKNLEHIEYPDQVGWLAGNKAKSGDVCKQNVGKGSGWYYLNDTTGQNRCDGARQEVFTLANGGLMRFMVDKSYPEAPDAKGKLKKVVGNVMIDVNGEAPPNKYGRDAFYFHLGQDGFLYPRFGRDYSEYLMVADGYTFDEVYWNGEGRNTCHVNGETSTGKGCAARIIENGWDMDY